MHYMLHSRQYRCTNQLIETEYFKIHCTQLITALLKQTTYMFFLGNYMILCYFISDAFKIIFLMFLSCLKKSAERK